MLLLIFSHYLLDGMSIQRILGKLTGAEELISDAPLTARYYQSYRTMADADGTSAYWAKLLRGKKGYTLLEPAFRTVEGKRLRTRRFLLPMYAAKEYCRIHQVTIAAWIHAVLGAALVKLTGLEQVVFASMNSGRSELLTEDALLTGNYSAELPFVYKERDRPEDCQKQLVDSSRFCMWDPARTGIAEFY